MKKRPRLYFILFVLGCLSSSVALALYALQDNISYFYAPHEALARHVAPGTVFRLGGLVKKGSLEKRADDLSVAFTVTDLKDEVRVVYKGLLPDLFREGQGVIATGAFDGQGRFAATQLLAKHDEKYMPPEVAKALKP
jgi:cytochrome c-type biogenesis protein CcmE